MMLNVFLWNSIHCNQAIKCSLDGLESPSGHWTGRELGKVAKAIPVEKYKAVALKVEDEITMCVSS